MRLRRITTHGSWIPEVDGLRFVAIAATLLVHILDQTMWRGGLTLPQSAVNNIHYITGIGGRGVLLFFAISGFILGQPFLRQHMQHGQPVSLSRFYKRRLTRLEPPYLLSLLIYGVALAWFNGHAQSLLLPLLTQIFYVHNFFRALPSLNFVTWSLEVEVQFYLLAPVLGYLFAVRSKLARRGIMLALVVGSAYVRHLGEGVLSVSLPGQLQFFMTGFLLADLRATRTESQISRWWDAVGVAAWLALFSVSERFAWSVAPLLLLACLSAFNGPVLRRFLGTNWIAVTGGMCYSFYLLHMLVLQTAFKLTRHMIVPSNLLLTYIIQAVLLLACVVPVSVGYFVLIERPCMDPKWPHKVIARLRHRTRDEVIRHV